MDGLHPDEPEFSSETRCHCNIHVTLQEDVQQAYMHGMGPGKLGEAAMKMDQNRALLGRVKTWRRKPRDQLALLTGREYLTASAKFMLQ